MLRASRVCWTPTTPLIFTAPLDDCKNCWLHAPPKRQERTGLPGEIPKVRFAVSFAFPPSISDADALPSEQPADVELAIDLVWARRTISGGASVDEILATEPHVAVLSCDQDAIVKKKWDAKLNNGAGPPPAG